MTDVIRSVAPVLTPGHWVSGLRQEDCPIKVGFVVGRHLWGLVGPEVVAVGEYVRVVGGWIVPVKLKGWFREECALLLHTTNNTAVSIDTVVEVRSDVWACQYNLMHSKDPPKVVRGDDPRVLYLETQDREGFAHRLQLNGVTGPWGKDAVDQCIALYTTHLDNE